MCGIFGIASKKTISKKLIRKILLETKIRGKHATGISFIKNNEIYSKIINKSAEHLSLDGVETSIIIGHCRYSTSSLEYNQPIYNKEISIVHNGVITQKDPNEWDDNYKFTTKNDSEFILKSWIDNKHPINDYPNSSIASIILQKDGMIHFFRNEKRPLYFYQDKELFIISSTKNILLRSGFDNPVKTEACLNYMIDKQNVYTKEIRKYKNDLQ
jgi:glutamine phosphoribosylpyrophosphate amidotransferase|tara:strand:- start:1464 stop:2105 length:642 start_codon:yes stop_codon:yes gene_type:complete